MANACFCCVWLALVLCLCRCPQVLAVNGTENEELVGSGCVVRNLNAAPYLDYPRFSGSSLCDPWILECKVILNITWEQPVNQSCVSHYTLKLEREESLPSSGQPIDTSKCAEEYNVSVSPSSTHLVLSQEVDVSLWTHCTYNISVVTWSVRDNGNRSVSIVKDMVELQNEVPELVQVLKKWFPQPNGHYHLQAKFYISNFIRGITLFFADYTLPGYLGFVDVWTDGPVAHVTMTKPPLANPRARYVVNAWIELNFVSLQVDSLLSSEPIVMHLAAPVLPPGPVQHLAVSGDLDGDVANLLVNWSAPVELYTDGGVWYDVLLSIGNGTFESADNRSLMYSAKDTYLNVSVEADGGDRILVAVRGVNAQYDTRGNWTDAVLILPVDELSNAASDGSSDTASNSLLLALLSLLLPAGVIFVVPLCAVVCWTRYRATKRHMCNFVERPNRKKLACVLAMEEILSSGNYGSAFTVHFLSEEARELHGVVGDRAVAKVIHACEETQADVQREMDVMQRLKLRSCDNVVRMFDYGWQDAAASATIVMEFVEYGSLLEYLRWSGGLTLGRPVKEKTSPFWSYDSIGPMSEDDQLHFAVQISRGMEYIAGCEIIHCDLAARNVLLGRGKTVKIADFGLAQLGTIGTLHQTELPFRWMAPEAIITRQVSTKTDVWSFAVTLWEIWSYGQLPFAHMTNEEVIEAASLDPNCTLEQPKDCQVEVWDVMLACWDTTQQNRPHFSQLTEMTSGIQLRADEEDVGGTT